MPAKARKLTVDEALNLIRKARGVASHHEYSIVDRSRISSSFSNGNNNLSNTGCKYNRKLQGHSNGSSSSRGNHSSRGKYK